MRNRTPFLILCLLVWSSVFCQVENRNSDSSFADFLSKIQNTPINDRQGMTDTFFARLDSAPITESTDCYFIHSGPDSVWVAGDFSYWNPKGREFTRIEGTDFWYRKEVFPLNARFDYKLVVGRDWIIDSKNPNQISGGFGANSEVAMPSYVQPTEILKTKVPSGTMISDSIKSEVMGTTYQLRIYLPHGYKPSKKYRTVYFQDGAEYENLANTPNVLDNLIATKKVKPVIGVFVIPTNRNLEYAEGDKFGYRDFFVDELVPFIDREYSTRKKANARAVLGDSYGGNISAIIAFTRPEIFGNCGLHSGAFQVENYATNAIVADKVKDIKVASIWGSYEGDLTENMQKIKDHFVNNKYDLYWKELPEGHSWGLWRATLDDMLIHFFPRN